MVKKILTYGAVSGAIAGGLMSFVVLNFHDQSFGAGGMAIGYLTMLVALSLIFLAIKRHRDADLGGVIRFWRAFAIGLGVSFVASVIYALAWEATLAATGMDFAQAYAQAVIEKQKAAGVGPEALAKLTAEMARFQSMYANPVYRLPMTFVEIFPVGVLVSLISAALLRNPQRWPARA